MILWLTGLASAAEIRLSTEMPVEGQVVQLTVDAPDPSGEVVVTYRPGSAVPATEALALGPGGTARWVPAQPGRAGLAGSRGEERASRAVSVRFTGVPLGGVAVFLLAAGSLFGGIGWSLKRLMRDRAAGIAVGAPIDT